MKLEFNKKIRENLMGTGGVIKNDARSQLKLTELGKLEARAMMPLPDKFTLLSLGDNGNQLSNAYRLVEMTRHLKGLTYKMYSKSSRPLEMPLMAHLKP